MSIMAGKFVYNTAGQRVWVEDGGLDSVATGQSGMPRDAGGFQIGKSGAPDDGWNNLMNVDANREKARLLFNESANPYFINAAQVGPVTMNWRSPGFVDIPCSVKRAPGVTHGKTEAT